MASNLKLNRHLDSKLTLKYGQDIEVCVLLKPCSSNLRVLVSVYARTVIIRIGICKVCTAPRTVAIVAEKTNGAIIAAKNLGELHMKAPLRLLRSKSYLSNGRSGIKVLDWPPWLVVISTEVLESAVEARTLPVGVVKRNFQRSV